MKKILVAIVVVMSSLLSVRGQYMHVGVKAGANFANLTGDIENTSIRTSFHIGGAVEFKLSDSFSFQPELLYSSQGTKEDIDPATVISRIDYLNVPLMGKLYLTEWLSLQFAPQVGFLINAIQESDNPEITAEDLQEIIKKIDFGLNIGAGYTSPSGLFFDARYNLGLSDIRDDDADFKNGVIQVSVGYYFF